MLTGFGTESGTDDEEDDATNRQRTCGDLPAVHGGRLRAEGVFQDHDLFLSLREGIRITGKPACVSCR